MFEAQSHGIAILHWIRCESLDLTCDLWFSGHIHVRSLGSITAYGMPFASSIIMATVTVISNIVMPISLMIMQLSSNTLFASNGSTLKSNNSYVSGVQHTSMKAHGQNLAYTCNHKHDGHVLGRPLQDATLIYCIHVVITCSAAWVSIYRLNPDDVYMPATWSLTIVWCTPSIIVPSSLAAAFSFHGIIQHGYMDTLWTLNQEAVIGMLENQHIHTPHWGELGYQIS